MRTCILRPSSAHRWVLCPASAQREAPFPSTQSAAAAEGTAAHAIAEAAVLRLPLPDTSAEMRLGAQLYAKLVGAAEQRLGERACVETELRMNSIAPRMRGTVDAFVAGKGELEVFDYKFGRGLVEAKNNWQMLCYAAAIDALETTPPLEKVTLTIVQPRGFHPAGPARSWEISGPELAEFSIDLKEAADLALSPNPPGIPSADACRYCRAKAVCPDLKASVTTLNTTVCNTPAQLGAELKRARELSALTTAYAAGLEAEIEHSLRAGTSVPGWCFKRTGGRLEWCFGASETLYLTDLVGFDIARKKEPITPTQALARFKKDTLEFDTISALSRPGEGVLKLVEESADDVAAIFNTKEK